MKNKFILLSGTFLSLSLLASCGNPNKYTITFNSQGGSEVSSQTVLEGKKVIEPKSPTKDNMIFSKWTLDSEGSNEYNFDNAVNNSFELFAQWTNKYYVVSFDSDGGTAIAPIKVKENDAISKPINDPTKEGYTFIEWQYFDGEKYSKYDFTTPVTSSFTLKAVYSTNAITIDATSNNPKRGTVTGAGKYNHGEMVTINATANDGFDFTGWYDKDDKQISEYENYSFIANNDIVLTAKFTPIQYDIIYHNVNASEHTNPTSYNFETSKFNLKVAIRSGKVFKGWYTDSELTKSITEIDPSAHQGKIDLYAKWEDVATDKYVINFDTRNSTEYSIDSQVIDKDNTAVEPKYTPKWATLDGWYYKDNGVETKFDFATTITKNYDLYAKYSNEKTAYTGNLTFDLNANNGYSVAIKDGESESIIIPSVVKTTIAGVPYYVTVDTISQCKNRYVESITIPQTITGIDEQAFNNCSKLTTVTFLEDDTIKSDLTCISANAFAHCELLASVTLPEGVLLIKENAFAYCNKLTSINIPKYAYLYNNVFVGCHNLKKISIPTDSLNYTNTVEGTTYDDAIFEIDDDNYNLVCSISGNITLPEGKTNKILTNAFAENTTLSSVSIPNSVTEIEDQAFYQCKNLTTITLDATNSKLTTIGYRAFYGAGITSIALPNSVISIGEGIFSGCKNLTSLTLPSNSSFTVIPEYAFSSTTLSEINIPDNVLSIEKYAFYYSGNIKVNFTDNSKLNSIGVCAFSSSKIESINIPASVVTIHPGAFQYCSNLKSVYINNATVANYEDNYSDMFIHGDGKVIYVKSDIVVSASSYLIKGGYTRGAEASGYFPYTKA